MKTLKIYALVLCCCMAGIYATAQDGGEKVTQDRPVAEFNSIEFDIPAKLVLNQGETQSVKVEAPASAQDKIKVNIKDKLLQFDVKSAEFDNIVFYVTVKQIELLNIGGPAIVDGNGMIKSDKLTLKSEAASEVTLNLDVENLSTEISGASSVTLKGRAGTHTSAVGGAANLKAEELATKKTRIEAGGASYASVDASEELEGEISGASNLNYKSKPPIYKIEETGAGSSDQTDTTKLRVGDKDVLIFDHGQNKKFGDFKNHPRHERKGKLDLKVIGVDFGVNGYVNEDFKFEVPEGRAYLEPNYGRSFGVGIDFLNIGIPLSKKHVTLYLGPGFELNNCSFKNNYHLFSDSAMINAAQDPGVTYDKNKLFISWFRIPLIMTFNFNGFNFSLGVIGAVKTGSHTKQVIKDGETTYEMKTHDDFYLSPFKADATFRIGYGPINIFGNYTFTGMYRNGHGPKLYPVTIGLSRSLTSRK